jgi:DNA-binding phage protein
MYEAHGLKDTPAHRIYSEASLGKAYLNHMGILPLRKVQPEISPALLGQIMSTYYGGRAEVRIRRQITRVLYCDFRSMYPTVCTLMGLWRFVIAEGFDWSDWASEAQALLDEVQLRDLQDKSKWKSLTAIVQVMPDDDVFPVRAAYDGKSRTIGLNYLSARFPTWFTLADCIASKILTGNAPKIVSALKFMPRPVQQGIKPIKVAGRTDLVLDPAHGDFFRELIIRRGQVQGELKAEGDPHKRELLDAQQMMLKLLANSTSYGIYAEQNAQSHDRPRDVDLFGQEEHFRTHSKSVEEPGTHFHPLIATIITGAARLMLACAEKGAELNGIGWTFCDTDSLALARPDGMEDGEFLERCGSVTSWFDKLDPYGDGKSLFKVEDQNFSLCEGKPTQEHCPLYALAISAKRYVLFNLTPDRRPIIRKALAHGLGHLMEPYGERDAPKSIPLPPHGLAGLDVKRWQHDLWHQIVMAFLDGHPDRVDLPRARKLNLPARSRYGATTPALLRWFRHFNSGKPLCEQVKPFNFMSAFTVSKAGFAAAIANGDVDGHFIEDGMPSAVAPYDNNPVCAAAKCFDRNTGKAVPTSVLKTYREAMADYAWHPESKFENAGRDDIGVTQRRYIEAIGVEYIGKEANRLEEQFFLGESLEAHIEYGGHPEGQQRLMRTLVGAARSYGIGNIAKAAQISRQQLHAILSGDAEPKRKTVARLNLALVSLAGVQRVRAW